MNIEQAVTTVPAIPTVTIDQLLRTIELYIRDKEISNIQLAPAKSSASDALHGAAVMAGKLLQAAMFTGGHIILEPTKDDGHQD